MEAAGDLDHLNILLKARSLKHGRWIEKILVQARKTLCGVGVNDLKDLTDKQLTALPNLTGPGNHATWENAILKLISSIKDGKQLVHLLKVLSYLEENIPLGPEFKELSCAVFKLSTATTEQIKMRAEFQRDWQRFVSSDYTETIEGAPLEKLEAKPLTPGESEQEGADIFPRCSEVEVLMSPPKASGQKKKAQEGGADIWMEATIVNHSTDSAGQVTYVCYVPKDYHGKDAHRTQIFPADKVRLVYQPSKTLQFTPKPAASSVSPSKLGSPALAVEEYQSATGDAIALGYDPEKWEPGVMIWMLSQCTARAQTLNTTIYGHVRDTITDLKLREQVTREIDGNVIKLLLNLRKRFGNNAGVLHIKNATEYGALKLPTDSIELANDLKTFRRYHEETDPRWVACQA